MSTCWLASDVFLADLTGNGWQAAFPGLTAAIGVGEDYPVSQRWGQKIQQAGFGGILYPAAHDLRLLQRSVALFGKPGEDEPAFVAQPASVSPDVMQDVTSEGWTILPAAPLGS